MRRLLVQVPVTASVVSSAPSACPGAGVHEVLELCRLAVPHPPGVHEGRVERLPLLAPATEAADHDDVFPRVDELLGLDHELLEVLGDCAEHVLGNALRPAEGAARSVATAWLAPRHLLVKDLEHGGHV